MTAEVTVPLAALVAVGGLLTWFYRYSHTRAWLHSETKLALWNSFAAFGPLFGVRVPPPKPPPPAVMAMHHQDGVDGQRAQGGRAEDPIR